MEATDLYLKTRHKKGWRPFQGNRKALESFQVSQFLRICNWEKFLQDLALQSFFQIAKGIKLGRLGNFLIVLFPIAFFKL